MEQLIKVIGGLQINTNQICVGDPGVQKEFWMNVDILPGLYQCTAYLQSTDGTEEHSSIMQISLLSMDNKPKVKPRIDKIGTISVDCGVAGFMFPETKDGRKTASKLIGKTKTIIDENVGFISVTEHGDGTYPVFTYTNEEGNIVGLTVPFM